MRRISSSTTFISKKIFPLVFFGFLIFFFVNSLLNEAYEKDPLFLAAPVVMAAFGIVMFKKFAGDLADEVVDHGDYLLVRRGGIEDRIPLSNIMNVSASTLMNPQRITLRLVSAGKLGTHVSFSPVNKFFFVPSASSAIAEELMERAFLARQKSAA